MAVGEWFSSFCSELRISTSLRSSISSRTGRIVGQLNLDFRSLDSSSANRFYVGSYGRNSAITSVSDIDLLYVLPYSTYEQYNSYAGNKQSALLSAVRTSLQKTYSSSKVAGDGQVVVISFTDNIRFEILPAFLNKDGSYTFADTNNGGSWKICRPKQEMDVFAQRNNECNGNLIQLSRMARSWRDQNSVAMNGMLIDTLAYQFIASWQYRDKSYLYYDFLTRDFFNYLAGQSSTQTYWLAPGSNSYVYRDGAFEYKARQAELRALEAIEKQENGQEWSAKQKYREIYGNSYPA